MSQTTDLDNNDVAVNLQFVVRANDASDGPDGALFSVQATAELLHFGGIGDISDFVVRVQVLGGWRYLDIPLSFSNVMMMTSLMAATESKTLPAVPHNIHR